MACPWTLWWLEETETSSYNYFYDNLAVLSSLIHPLYGLVYHLVDHERAYHKIPVLMASSWIRICCHKILSRRRSCCNRPPRQYLHLRYAVLNVSHYERMVWLLPIVLLQNHLLDWRLCNLGPFHCLVHRSLHISLVVYVRHELELEKWWHVQVPHPFWVLEWERCCRRLHCYFHDFHLYHRNRLLVVSIHDRLLHERPCLRSLQKTFRSI